MVDVLSLFDARPGSSGVGHSQIVLLWWKKGFHSALFPGTLFCCDHRCPYLRIRANTTAYFYWHSCRLIWDMHNGKVNRMQCLFQSPLRMNYFFVVAPASCLFCEFVLHSTYILLWKCSKPSSSSSYSMGFGVSGAAVWAGILVVLFLSLLSCESWHTAIAAKSQRLGSRCKQKYMTLCDFCLCLL